MCRVILARALLVLHCGPGGGRRGAPSRGRNEVEGVPPLGPVFVLIGENTDYQHLDATDSPYMMNNLRPRSAWFTNYYAATHWSQANYIALTSGQFTDCEQADYGYACRDDVDNVFHQLERAHAARWHVWLEAGTAKCDTGSGGSCTSNDPCPLTGFYTTGNPPINYTTSRIRTASRTTSLQATRPTGCRPSMQPSRAATSPTSTWSSRTAARTARRTASR